jgi:hypothetical protein
VLAPLLEHESAQVRYSAAAHLLNRGGSDQAVPVLEEIADDEDLGSVGSFAEAALAVWRRNQVR